MVRHRPEIAAAGARRHRRRRRHHAALPAVRAEPEHGARRAGHRRTPDRKIRFHARAAGTGARHDPRARRRGGLQFRHGQARPHLQHVRRPPPAALGRARRQAKGPEAGAARRLLHQRRRPELARAAGARGGRRGPRRRRCAGGPEIGPVCAGRARRRTVFPAPRHQFGPGRHHQRAPPDFRWSAGSRLRARAARNHRQGLSISTGRREEHPPPPLLLL
uniref:Uncharacterized protein n=1 Tax=Tanacetum cinerariifolium TaxID=118510 RepID=A0A699GKL4_TANCI|nr:hypothetical protein [Tanacetum cinerariifolium]